jgi:23S rRNA (adenine2503-C2)-methyltransferase
MQNTPIIHVKLNEVAPRKRDIRSLNIAELGDFLVQKGEKSFRAKQIYEWIWQKSMTDFDLMHNLSQKLREMLKEEFAFYPVIVAEEQVSADGTVKSGFRLHDGHLVEGVLIPVADEDRMTACVSSQVGCSLSCKFCATGYMDKKRNLEPAEIYDQVVLIHRQALKYFGKPLTNIVFMGMGEPLLNYQNVLAGIEKITSPEGLNMASRRITVSTAGIAKMIVKLADDNVKFNLALSLHAANDTKRNQIMPINDSNNLKVLGAALQYFYQKTKNRITFEYILFNRFNDQIKDAEELAKFARKIPCRINILEYNPIAEAEFAKSKEENINAFAKILNDRGITTTVRRSRGKDIDAACGQLANKKSENHEK